MTRNVKLSIIAGSLSQVLALGSSLGTPRPVTAAAAAAEGSCRSCDQAYDPGQLQYFHRSIPLFFSDVHGSKVAGHPSWHSDYLFGNCLSHHHNYKPSGDGDGDGDGDCDPCN
jgi:hypothetical protein